MPSSCCVPLCHYSHNSSQKQRALFVVHRPDLGRKLPVARKHYEYLTKFLLSLRKDDHLKIMLHKESAAICENHFKVEDIILRGKQKTLRFGALPCYNIPVKYGVTSNSVSDMSDQNAHEKQTNYTTTVCEIQYEGRIGKIKLPRKSRKRIMGKLGNHTVVKLERLRLPLDKFPENPGEMDHKPEKIGTGENLFLGNSREKFKDTEEDKRTTFEKIMFNCIQMQNECLNKAYKLLDHNHTEAEENKAISDHNLLLETFPIMKKLNSVAAKYGKIDNYIEQIGDMSPLNEWLKTNRKENQEECNKASVKLQSDIKNNNKKPSSMEISQDDKTEFNFIENKTTKANIPLSEIVFQTDTYKNTTQPTNQFANMQMVPATLLTLVPEPITTEQASSNKTPTANNPKIDIVSVNFSPPQKKIKLPNKPHFVGAVLIPGWNTRINKFNQQQPKNILKMGRTGIVHCKAENKIISKQKARCRLKTDETKLKFQQDKARFTGCKLYDDKLGAVYKCDACGKYLKKWWELRTHYRHHTGELNRQCEVCNKTFTASYLKAHMLTHSKNRSFSCEKCGMKFLRRNHLKAHLSSLTACTFPAFECLICNEKFEEIDKIDKHFVTMHCGNETHCDECDDMFNESCIDSKHKLKLLKPYKCERCCLAYSFKRTLQQHNRDVHGGAGGRRVRSETDENHDIEQKFMCEYCPKTYASKSRLMTHRRSHKDHFCKTCGEKFSHSANLNLHKRRVHTMEKPYRCENCLEGFLELKLLHAHSCSVNISETFINNNKNITQITMEI